MTVKVRFLVPDISVSTNDTPKDITRTGGDVSTQMLILQAHSVVCEMICTGARYT